MYNLYGIRKRDTLNKGNEYLYYMEKKLKAIRVDLNEELAADFEDIKRYFGIMSDSDMIRFLIREKKKEIIQEDVYNLLSKHEKP